MAELIDITDFGGVVTNVDVEDLPEHIAQNMENLRIRDGKLEKTFGAGQPTDIPSFALSQLNTKLSKSYVVYNVFTFISDKFTTKEYRYILVLIDSSTKEVLLFWYDPSLPAITDHLQVEDNIFWFKTESSSGLTTGKDVMIVNAKDNSSSAIANTDMYGDIEYIGSNEHHINVSQAPTWGGSFFATSNDTGCRLINLGGKHGTHLALSTNTSQLDNGHSTSSFKNIALLALNGKVLCMYSFSIGGGFDRIWTTLGSNPSPLGNSNYVNLVDSSDYTSMYVASMITFNDAIYVHYSGVKSGTSKISNFIYKYTVASNGTISETLVNDDFLSALTTPSASASVPISYFYTFETGDCFLLIPGSGLWKMATTDSAFSVVSGTPSNTSGYSWIGMTSITNTVSGTANYLVLAETKSSTHNHKLHYGLYNSVSGNFTWTDSGVQDNTLHYIDKMDFGENSNKNESLVIHTEKSDATLYVQYSTANNSNIVLAWADLSSSNFTTSTVITFIKHSYKNPNGTKYLHIGTNDSGAFGSGMVHGRLYRIDTSKTVSPLNDNNPDSYKGWNPTCFDDVVTGFSSGNYFFTHAKAHIGAYGIEYSTTASVAKSALNRFTDIGWGSGAWNGTGTVDYRWTNLNDKYTFPEISETNVSSTSTIYHNTDKNPIVPTNDTVRFIPGAIGRVSNTEAKSLWLGYISRTLFNGTVTIASDWYGYTNKLNNPFKVKLKKTYTASEALHAGQTLKYNCTAVYDGVQESLFDKNDELVITEPDTNKKIHELEVEIANINDLNKRITGINFYRSVGSSGVYSNYQLIGHMTFVDSSNDLSSVPSAKNVSVRFFNSDIVHLDLTTQGSLAVTQVLAMDYREIAGNNKTAVGFGGGFDGVDQAYEGEDSLAPGWISAGTIRPMNATQTYMVINSNASVANSTNYIIEIPNNIGEGIQTASTALPSVPLGSALDTGFTLANAHTWSADTVTTFTVTADISNVIKVGDKIQLGSHTASTITITEVTTTSFKGTSTVGGTTISGNVKLVDVASGEYIVTITRAVLINYANQDYADTADPGGSGSAGTGVAHSNGVTVNKVPVVNYIKLDCDNDASFSNGYLNDSGSFVGTSWSLKEKSWGQYDTRYHDNGNFGAYGGSAVGLVLFPNFATDYPSGITENLLTGSIINCGSKSIEIESNGVYKADLGGVWVKATEHVGTLTAEGELLQGFNVSSAQGSSTPGVGYAKDSNKITITCRDFRLEDLGETPNQTIYSNRVNGQYAKQLKGRLFLGSIYLNPEGKSEERKDWIAYSELNQFDTIPVSNVIALDDREGGDITGLGVLFSRLVIFKPQAIFVLNVTDPTTPSSWSVAESKHNIGNVATQGVVEVHDSIYFVYHDGIYRLSSNTIASSTATPSVMDKVSDPIDDQFQLITDKTAIVGIFDPARQEIIYKWLEGSDQKVWGYNYVKKSWRKIDMGTGVINMLNYDENGRPLNYDRTNNKIIKFDTANASISKWKSKRFPLDLHRKRLLRYGTVQFVGTDTLTYNLYLDGAGSASFTKSITADGGIVRFPIKRYAKKFEIELSTASSTNAFTLERLQIEME